MIYVLTPQKWQVLVLHARIILFVARQYDCNRHASCSVVLVHFTNASSIAWHKVHMVVLRYSFALL